MIVTRRHPPGLFALLLFILLLSPGCGGGGDSATSIPTPTVTTLGVSLTTVDNAVLNGSVSPNGLATNAWFEWGPDPGLAASTSTPSQPLGSGMGDNIVSQKITGLDFGTTYYFRVAGSNSAGITKGLIVPFTTASLNTPPTVQTFSADNISVTAMTFHGSVIPNGLATDAWFEYGTDNTFTNPTLTYTTTHRAKGSGMTSVQIDEPITGLDVATTYYFRVVASNSVGTSRGLTGSLSTSALTPTVTTQAADNVTTSGANLKGLVIPNGLATDAWFEYGTDNTFTNPTLTYTTTHRAKGSGMTSVQIDEPITGLDVATTYYFRVVASNSVGTSRGLTGSLSTSALTPTVTTQAADNVTTSGANLKGLVIPNGLATDAWFEYGTDNTFTNPTLTYTTTHRAKGSGMTSVQIDEPITGLDVATTYYFRVVASNSAGTSNGSIESFTTAAPGLPTVETQDATGITTGGVTLNGTANPKGLATNASFNWGTTPTLSYPSGPAFNTTSPQSLGSGFTAQSTSAMLTSLISGTTYYFQVNATNSAGTSTGTILSFTTASLARGTFKYNSSGRNASVHTGNSKAIIFSRTIYNLPNGKGGTGVENSAGVLSLDFSPTVEYGSGGDISIRLLDTSDTYFQLSIKDSSVTKVRKGVVVDSAAFPFPYNQGTTYPIKISFSQDVTTFEAFGGTVSLTSNTSANPIIYFEVETTQQDAFYDNIKLETGNPLYTIFFDDFSADTTGNYAVY